MTPWRRGVERRTVLIISKSDWDRIRKNVLRHFPEREIYLRSEGNVRFIRFSTNFQLKVAAGLLIAAFAGLIFLAVTLVMRVNIASQQAELGAKAERIHRTEARVAAFRSSVDQIAERLEERQDRLEKIVGRYFGATRLEKKPREISSRSADFPPEARRLAAVEQDQAAFVAAVREAALDRSIIAEKALRRVGLRVPGASPTRREVGVGGPYLPLEEDEEMLFELDRSLQRLDRLEKTILVLPAFVPTSPVSLSSGFGVRSDPFTRRLARHAGLDIRGFRGQHIPAAAAGRIVRASRWSGYGNVVVIDHGRGFQTRYGHLSSFDVRPGQYVKSGQLIARMGSTGRSTGNHLHFEVVINGRHVNPRPFIDSATYVRDIQVRTKERMNTPLRLS